MKGLINSKYDGIDCQFNEDGWFNATLAASKFDKRPIDWLRLDETQNYINALCEQLGISEPKSLIKAKRNNGTWLHPKLAVPFTRWLDTRFGVWCDLQIDQLLRGNHPVIDIRRLRHQAAATYKAVCIVLQESRQQQGKETKPHHYMNEARLINWAMTGQFTRLDRDSLTFEEMDLLAALEAQDLVLIAKQCSYEQRKTALSIFNQNFKEKRLKSSNQLGWMEA
ncbi:KilA-N domain-containing protein [Acinetobacter brisouii]